MPSLPVIENEDEKRSKRASGSGVFDAPVPGSEDPALLAYYERLGDDALILGQRLSDHNPITVDLPVEEPVIGSRPKNFTTDDTEERRVLRECLKSAKGA